MSYARASAQAAVLATDVATTVIPVALNLGGLTPAVIRVIGINRGPTTSAGVAAGDLVFSYGIGLSASSRYSAAVGSDSGAATSDTAAILRSDCVLNANLSPIFSTNGRLDINSVAADAVELIVDQQFTVDMNFYVIAEAGDVFANAALVQWAKQAGTGDQDVTGAGFATTRYVETLGVGGTAINSAVGGRLTIGRATTSPVANQVLNVVVLDNAATSDTASYCNDVEHIVVGTTTGSPTARGSVTGAITDGFRVNWAENAAGAQIFVSLCLGGTFQCAVGSLLTEDDTTTEIESAIGFPFGLAVLLSHGQAESTLDTAQAHARISAGFALGPLEASLMPQQGCISWVDVDNLADTAAAGVMLDIDAAAEGDYINIDTAGAIDGIAQMFASASPPANSLVHKMTNADPTPALLLYAAFGDAAVATGDFSSSAGQSWLRRALVMEGS